MEQPAGIAWTPATYLPAARENRARAAAPVPQSATTRTTQPMVTGTSVLGLVYDGGVMLAADTLGSYGSLARFREISRFCVVGQNTAVAAAGDYADFQEIKLLLNDLVTQNNCQDDGHPIAPHSIHSYLTRLMYARRSRFNPLWNTLVVGGFHDGKVFLGYVDKLGVSFSEEFVASGFGGYLAIPLIRKRREELGRVLTRDEARALLEDCLRVLFYRDARSLNRVRGGCASPRRPAGRAAHACRRWSWPIYPPPAYPSVSRSLLRRTGGSGRFSAPIPARRDRPFRGRAAVADPAPAGACIARQRRSEYRDAPAGAAPGAADRCAIAQPRVRLARRRRRRSFGGLAPHGLLPLRPVLPLLAAVWAQY